MKNDNWWKNAFEDGVYPLLSLTRSQAFIKKTRQQVRFIDKEIGLPRRAAILDLCCGVGRHTTPLAIKGYRVTGVDISSRYLREARKAARNAGVEISFEKADMRRLAFRNEFDLIINMFSSFGYFPDRLDDLKTLRGVRRALKPGGKFLIETINGFRILHGLDWGERMSDSPQRWSTMEDGTLVLERSELLRRQSAVRAHWTFLRGKRKRTMTSFMRQYTKESLSRLLRRAGLRPLRFYGDTPRSPYRSRHSRRMTVLAIKN